MLAFTHMVGTNPQSQTYNLYQIYKKRVSTGQIIWKSRTVAKWIHRWRIKYLPNKKETFFSFFFPSNDQGHDWYFSYKIVIWKINTPQIKHHWKNIGVATEKMMQTKWTPKFLTDILEKDGWGIYTWFLKTIWLLQTSQSRSSESRDKRASWILKWSITRLVKNA